MEHFLKNLIKDYIFMIMSIFRGQKNVLFEQEVDNKN